VYVFDDARLTEEDKYPPAPPPPAEPIAPPTDAPDPPPATTKYSTVAEPLVTTKEYDPAGEKVCMV
jgi:hypothetical protein